MTSPVTGPVWLIEWPEDDNVPVRWWNPAYGWMRDANKALHFARQTDADCYLSTMRFGRHLKVTEHKFGLAISQPAPPQPSSAENVDATTIPWKDGKRQFPLYELAPDLTLYDRDAQADERLKLYRDIFAEITAKAIPITDETSDDPERVRGYRLPVGPIHRAAGKLGFQLFNGENYLAEALKEIERLKATPALIQPAPPQSSSDQSAGLREVLDECRSILLQSVIVAGATQDRVRSAIVAADSALSTAGAVTSTHGAGK